MPEIETAGRKCLAARHHRRSQRGAEEMWTNPPSFTKVQTAWSSVCYGFIDLAHSRVLFFVSVRPMTAQAKTIFDFASKLSVSLVGTMKLDIIVMVAFCNFFVTF